MNEEGRPQAAHPTTNTDGQILPAVKDVLRRVIVLVDLLDVGDMMTATQVAVDLEEDLHQTLVALREGETA
jgi:hypothetical protein